MEVHELQHEIYRSIVDTTDDAGVMTDSDDRILSFGQAAVTEIFGYTLAEMAGAHIQMLLPEITTVSREDFLLRSGLADEGEIDAFGHSVMMRGYGHSVPGRRRDGSVVPLNLSITEERGDDGARRFHWIIRDVTNRMRLYDDLRTIFDQAQAAAEIESALLAKVQASNRDLKISNEDLLKFTSIVAHDLRGPLRRIEAFVEALQIDFRPSLNEEGADILDRIAKGANRMRLMLDSLLQYSRYSSVAIAGKTAKLSEVVGDALSAFDTETLGVRVSVALNDVPDVRGDPILLSHVLQNLIGNAVKFRSEASPTVTIDARQTGREVRVTVTDNGIGIEPRFAGKIFEMFYRLHDEDAYEGTGLGLTVCRKIVQDHGGSIWLDETAEDATRFVFTLITADAADLLANKPASKARYRLRHAIEAAP